MYLRSCPSVNLEIIINYCCTRDDSVTELRSSSSSSCLLGEYFNCADGTPLSGMSGKFAKEEHTRRMKHDWMDVNMLLPA